MIRRGTFDDNGRRFASYLQKALDALEIDWAQFDALGHVFEAVVNLSRRRTRNAANSELEGSIRELDAIVEGTHGER